MQQSPLTLGSGDPYAFAGRQFRHLPLWIFHGDADAVIPVEDARRLVAALCAEQAPVRYTEYAGVGHNSWDRAYSDPEVWAWLFTQVRKAK